jgi:hypothetical protein
MKPFYDKLIAFTILGTFLWTTAMAVHNLYEIQISLDRVEQERSDLPYADAPVEADAEPVMSRAD